MNRNLLVVGIQKITQNRVQGFKARYFRRILTPALSPDGREGEGRLAASGLVEPLASETDELIRIFRSSIKTAEKRKEE
jgi:hypothetical protein